MTSLPHSCSGFWGCCQELLCLFHKWLSLAHKSSPSIRKPFGKQNAFPSTLWRNKIPIVPAWLTKKLVTTGLTGVLGIPAWSPASTNMSVGREGEGSGPYSANKSSIPPPFLFLLLPFLQFWARCFHQPGSKEGGGTTLWVPGTAWLCARLYNPTAHCGLVGKYLCLFCRHTWMATFWELKCFKKRCNLSVKERILLACSLCSENQPPSGHLNWELRDCFCEWFFTSESRDPSDFTWSICEGLRAALLNCARPDSQLTSRQSQHLGN